MGTGVQPISDLEFDIDVGLRFPIESSQYTAPEVRKWVLAAVDGHTDSVVELGPCIRVGYAKGYHVDLVAYATWTDLGGNEQYRLAHRTDGWREANPPGLLEYVKQTRERYAGTEDTRSKTDQFRRLVRYLKRWGDVAIPYDSEAKPVGLSYVLYVATHGNPAVTWDGASDDRTALASLAAMAAKTVGRIVAHKPTPEYEDIFSGLSEKHMSELKERFAALSTALYEAAQTTDPVKACMILQEAFGSDFPIPEPADTGKKTSGPAIVTSASSA